MYPLNGPSWSLFFEYIGNLLYALHPETLYTPLAILAVSAGYGLPPSASGVTETYAPDSP